jgi:hypothetical protein
MGRKNKLRNKQISQRELERRIAQALTAIESRDDSDYTWPLSITEWCDFRRIGRTSWYRWKSLGVPLPDISQPAGPHGIARITREADAAWYDRTRVSTPVSL